MTTDIRDRATHTVRFDRFEIDVYDAPRGVLTKEDLFDDVITVVAEARGWSTREQHDSIRRTYKFQPFLDADRVFVIRQDGAPKGFCSVRFLERGGDRIHHLSNAAMVPELQSKGAMAFVALAYPALIDSARADFAAHVSQGRQFFTFISQSPVVYGAMSRAGKIYPALDGSPAPDNVRQIASL